MCYTTIAAKYSQWASSKISIITKRQNVLEMIKGSGKPTFDAFLRKYLYGFVRRCESSSIFLSNHFKQKSDAFYKALVFPPLFNALVWWRLIAEVASPLSWCLFSTAGVLKLWCCGAHKEIDHYLRSPTINFISAVIASLDSCKIIQVSILISKRIDRGAPKFLSRSPGAAYGALWEPMFYSIAYM